MQHHKTDRGNTEPWEQLKEMGGKSLQTNWVPIPHAHPSQPHSWKGPRIGCAGHVTWRAGSRHVTPRDSAHWSSIMETLIGHFHNIHSMYYIERVLPGLFLQREKWTGIIGFSGKQHKNNASCLPGFPVNKLSRWCLYSTNTLKRS